MFWLCLPVSHIREPSTGPPFKSLSTKSGQRSCQEGQRTKDFRLCRRLSSISSSPTGARAFCYTSRFICSERNIPLKRHKKDMAFSYASRKTWLGVTHNDTSSAGDLTCYMCLSQRSLYPSRGRRKLETLHVSGLGKWPH